jgi:hypothetical protein
MNGYCPHFKEEMELENCFFCHSKLLRNKEMKGEK